MTARPDLDRAIRAFLDEGVTELPGESYDAVRERIERTRQRVVLGPWKEPPMSRIAAAALAAAAVLAIAVIASNLLPARVTGPGASPSPTAPASSPSPTSLAYTWPGRLAAGTYSTSFTWDVPFEVSFTVPAGWESRDIEVVRDPVVTLAFALVGNTYADPCRHVLADPPTGDTVDDLAAALAAMPGLETRAPRAATLAGYGGTAVEATVRSDSGCPAGNFLLWNDPDRAHLPVSPLGPPTWSAERPNMVIWILDVQGLRLVVSQMWADAATPADLAELQAVIDSVRIVPPSASMTIGACTLTVVSPSRGGAALSPPYTAMLGSGSFDLRGPVPSPFPSLGITAQLDYAGEGWTGRPGGDLIAPSGGSSSGFQTSMTVNGFQGSLVFNAPGTWWVRIGGGTSGCLRQFPVLVTPPGG